MNHEVPENPFQMKLEAPFLLTQHSEKPTVFYNKKLYAVIPSLEVKHNHQHTIPTGNSKTELFFFVLQLPLSQQLHFSKLTACILTQIDHMIS